MSSSNTSFTPAPGDGGQLKRKDGPDGSVVYDGCGRQYVVTPKGKQSTVAVRLDGISLPERDKIDLDSSTARKKLADKVAGPENPPFARTVEKDLRQIAADQPLRRSPTVPGNLVSEQRRIARFDDLVDLVRVGNEVRFCERSTIGKLIAKASTKIDGVDCLPPDLAAVPFAIPEFASVRNAADKSPRDLWAEITEWISRSAVPPAGCLDVLVAWVFHTHCCHKSLHSPIISLVGVQEHGKTRLGKALLYPSRRGILTETPRQAHLLRYASDLDATLFLDLYDAWGSIRRTGIEDIILHRFSRGTTVSPNPLMRPLRNP